MSGLMSSKNWHKEVAIALTAVVVLAFSFGYLRGHVLESGNIGVKRPPQFKRQQAVKRGIGNNNDKSTAADNNNNFCESLASSESESDEPFCMLFRNNNDIDIENDVNGYGDATTTTINTLRSSVRRDEYNYFRVCIAKHAHYHKVKLHAKITNEEIAKVRRVSC